MCNSKECVNARIALQGVQMRIFALCQQMNFVRQRMLDALSAAISFSLLAAMALALAMIAAVAAAIFPFIPAGLAIIMFVIAALSFILSVILFEAARAFERQLRNLQKDMQTLLDELANAVNTVMENCPPECWESIDFRGPTC